MESPYRSTSSVLGNGVYGRKAWIDAIAANGPIDVEAIAIVQTYHALAPEVGVNPDFALAQGVEETAWFDSYYWRKWHNPCGLGITGPGVEGLDYKTIAGGVMAHLAHICCYAYDLDNCPVHDSSFQPKLWGDPRHNFHDKNPKLSHFQEPIPGRRWAEGPNYVEHILAVLGAVARYATGGSTVTGLTGPIIAHSAGHRNTDGGDAYEMQQTAEINEEFYRQGRLAGFRMVSLTNDGPDADDLPGDAMMSIGLQAVARKINSMNPLPLLFIEIHTEGGGSTGVFGIFPNKGGDYDAEVEKVLAPLMARKVSARTGLGVRAGGGAMPETATGVGSNGDDRLGVFFATMAVKDTVTRMILEVGAHDKQPDLDISKRPDFARNAAAGMVDALREWTGFNNGVDTLGKAPIVTPPTTGSGDPISKALLAWYARLPVDAQGSKDNAAFYEATVDFSSLVPSVQGPQRALIGEYLSCWYHATGAVLPIHSTIIAKLLETGKVQRR